MMPILMCYTSVLNINMHTRVIVMLSFREYVCGDVIIKSTISFLLLFLHMPRLYVLLYNKQLRFPSYLKHGVKYLVAILYLVLV